MEKEGRNMRKWGETERRGFSLKLRGGNVNAEHGALSVNKWTASLR